jgi:Ca-activated chloride channel family protein
VDIQRSDDHNVTAGYEASNVLPDTDFSLYYSVGESEAFHLLSYRDPADPTDPDGFFLLLLAPKPETSAQPMPKDVLVVLDHSGSMDGEKFQQAQAALNFILGHLNPNDRFNVVAFSTAVDTYAAGMRPASEAPQALTWAEKISAGGTTDINSALLEAASMADNERPTYVIFLTDGLPTVGETDSQKIIDNFAAAAPDSLRLFAFGVGYDVDTFLLDSLTAAHHGASTYVQPGDDLDKVISTFFSQISTPVLTNLSLDFGGMSTYDIYPASLPDLFLGSQIVVVGRYRDGGVANVTLSGQVEGKTQTFRYDEQAFTQDSRIQSATLDALPRLWATRKIGYLLNQVRLKGADPETIDQIVKLSIRYGIVTPYTSYLVTDSQVLGVDAQEKIANDTYQQIQSAPAAAPSGQAAVNRAAGQGGMQNAQAPAEAPASAADQVRVIGAHTFLFTNNTWTDTRFDPKTMSTIKVAFLSPDYFTLAQSSPDLADALALGERVIVMVNGTAYEVVAEGTTVAPLVIPTAGTIVQPTIVGTSIVQTTPAAPTETPSLAPEGTQVATPTSAPRAESHTCLGGLLPLGVVLIGGWWWNQRKRCQRI